MTFQAYIDNIYEKTKMMPSNFYKEATKLKLLEKGYKAAPIIAWLKKDYKLGHGHAMAIYGCISGKFGDIDKIKPTK
jgi:Domain of unknown function (DUF4287)